MTGRTREGLAVLAWGAGLFAVYAAGASPTIFVGDSGELVTAVHLLGIPHPSGYPLYVLLGKLWTILLPVGSIAYRMSLFSAACAAAACALVALLCRRAGLGWIAALTASGTLAFSPSFWGEANIQRVYALNALFVAGATAAAFAWHRTRAHRWLAITLLACGLGATNHTFMAIYALAFVIVVAAHDRRALLGRAGLAAGAAFGSGLLPYVYLPLRSRADPALDWGNPETLTATLAVVLRRGFWERRWVAGLEDLFAVAVDYLRGFGDELTWAGAALAVLGAIAARRHRPVLLIALVMAGNLGALALHGSRSDIFIWHRYYIPSYLMAAVLIAFAVEALRTRLPAWIGLAPLAIPLALLIAGWPQADRSRYRIAEAFSRTLLATLPPGAHLGATDDNILFVLMYLHFVERVRPDVNLILQGVGDAQLPPLRFHPASDPLFFTHSPNWRTADAIVQPEGLVFRTMVPGSPPPPPPSIPPELDGERDPRVPKDYLTSNLIGHYHYMLGLTYAARDWTRARGEFAKAAAAAPQNDVLFYNLGLIYRQHGLLDESLDAFERSAAINPRRVPGSSAPAAAVQVERARRERERIASLERDAEAFINSRAERGAADRHLAIAAYLEQRGEWAAARGHRLRAALERSSP
jgi:tetratricopeptide (TPR) repeat protein